MFSYEELNMLEKGLDSLRADASKSNMLFGLLKLGMTSDEERGEDFDAFEKEEGEEEKQKLLEDQIVLLKAKLIRARSVLDAEDVASSLISE